MNRLLSSSRFNCLRLIVVLFVFAILSTPFVVDSLWTATTNAASTYPRLSSESKAASESLLASHHVTSFPNLFGRSASLIDSNEKGDARSVANESELNEKDDSVSALTDNETRVTETASAAPRRTAAAAVKFDFDGDGSADISRSRVVTSPSPAVHEIRYRDSSNGTFAEYSLAVGSGKIVPGNFNGDSQTDAAIFSNGTWTYKTSTGGSAQTISLGTTGDIPVAADYDGDGTTDAAVFRPSTGVWYIKESQSGSTVNTTWGQSGDIPTPGDYDGDGESDFAVWRPSNGIWYLNRTSAGSYTTTWGVSATDIAVPADFDGDGKTDIAVFRRTTGVWYVRKSNSHPYDPFSTWTTQSWGNYGDQPVPADYDADGKDDYAIWRPKTGWWWIVYSSNQSIQTFELGVQGNMAVPSAYLQQVGGAVPIDELAAERLKPRNATGGTDLYSQNFSWGRNLVSLPGRSGFDLSLGIGYNSLVWTKADSEIYFDLDMANVTPGFRFGFPTIEPIYFDEGKSKFAYMMVTNSGSRIQFRETTVSNVYETADSSYTVLETTGASNPNDPVENITITVKTTDGTQMKYEWRDGAFKCTQIKDRNGNYISIVYNAYGNLETITDTLGRVVTVTYTTDRYPSTITQTWKDTNGSGSNVTNIWATLSYTTKTVDTDFDGASIVGTVNTASVPVLDKITYPDQSYTKFHYNGYIQVSKIETYADNDDKLNYVRTDLDAPAANQTDCPRFTETGSWARNFNVDPEDISPSEEEEEVVVTNTAPANSTFTVPGGSSQDTSYVEVVMPEHPDDVYQIIHFARTGWSQGLPVATRDCIGGGCSDEKRWTWTNWTQDNTGVSYRINPRVTESRVGDGTNTRKTAIEYYTTGGGVYPYGLPVKVEVGSASTVLKTFTTSYDLDSDYTSRRIIGLPSERKLYEGTTAGTLMSRVTYSYDDGDFTDSGLSQNVEPLRHDHSNYGAGFIGGRGNLTTVTRWDVTDSSNEEKAVVSTTKYNTAGSVVAQTTPGDGTSTRTVKFGYADNWNHAPVWSPTPTPTPPPSPTPTPTPSPTPTPTYAYPTTITDPADNSTVVLYRFDIGANVDAISPGPAGNAYGKRSKRTFDSIGRLQREAMWKYASGSWSEHAYTRHVYPDNGLQSLVYTTLIDTVGSTSGPDTADEVQTERWTDGAGRVRRSRTEHPGSDGGWSAVMTEYDILGRVARQSVPTEVDNSWDPDGDDSAFLWNKREYDWMGRVERTIPSDSNGSDGRDTVIEYTGCGCAGGLETLIKGPATNAFDVAGEWQTGKRRTQKTYSDILGRVFKTEVWDLDTGSSPYSTVKTTFNGRDQATLVQQYAGSDSSGTYQDTIATYDGHGRLASQHVPQQDDNTETTFTYFPDDQVHIRTDARGATNTYTYGDDRGLLTKIESEIPGTTNSGRSNFALANNGGIANASSEFSNMFPKFSAINGDRTGSGWGYGSGGWSDGSYNNHPDWLQVNFSESRAIDEINVITLQDNYASPIEPTETTTFTEQGITDYYLQYWNGSGWTNIAGASASSNDKVWRKFTFTPVTTIAIRVVITGALNSFSRVVELEAWGPDTVPPVNTETNFTYDPAGNRLTMTDSSGSTAYEYNSLSQLTAETRSFNDTLTNAPLSGNSFELQYSYTLAGGLKSITDPYGEVINYGFEKTGRLDEVTGSTFGGITDYVTGAEYRAWGGLKGLTYSNGVATSTTYNARLQPEAFHLTKDSTDIMHKEYEYYPDGLLRYTEDKLNGIFDRLNIYDHAGRIKEGKSGAEARGGTVTTNQSTDLPYRQSYEFNQFDNLTERNNLHWGTDEWYGQSNNLAYTYEDNRITNAGWVYDADGRVLTSTFPDNNTYSTYDARGLIRTYHTMSVFSGSYDTLERYYDGDGREVKREKMNFTEDYEAEAFPWGTWSEDAPIYYIRSTVLGGAVISETYEDGKKKKTYVMAGGMKLATQSQYEYSSTTTESVSFDHFDPTGKSYRSSLSNGTVNTAEGFEGGAAEMDPFGANFGLVNPYVVPDPPLPPTEDFPYFFVDGESPMYVNGQQVQCFVDGMRLMGGCGRALGQLGRSLDVGSADPSVLSQLGIFIVSRGIRDSPDPEYPVTRYVNEYWGMFSFDISIDGGGGGGGRNQNGPKARFDKKKLDKCLKELFNAVLTSESLEEGLPGLTDDSIWHGVTIAGVAAMLQTTLEKDSVTIGKEMLDRGVGDGSPNAGVTYDRTPFHNYIASDVYRNLSPVFRGGTTGYTGIGFKALKIHELGNALAGARRQLAQGRNNPEYGIRDTLKNIGGYGEENKKYRISDPDAGAALEICVFGGLVNLRSGRVGTTRGL